MGGIHLAVSVIPKILSAHSNVCFVIGGDGPCKALLDAMLDEDETDTMRKRVHLLGAVPHINVRNVLCRGHIFLNCSLTESFCIAILEAACCGLLVVSTDVGGVPEVLPPHMAYLA